MTTPVSYTERMAVLRLFATESYRTREWTDREFEILSDLRARIMVEWTPVNGYRITRRGIAAIRPAKEAA